MHERSTLLSVIHSLHNYGIVDLAGHDFSDFNQISERRFVATVTLQS